MEIRLKDEISYDDKVIVKGFLTEGNEEWTTEDRVETVKEVISRGSNFVEFINSRGQYRFIYDIDGAVNRKTSLKESDVRGIKPTRLLNTYIRDFESMLLDIDREDVSTGDFGIRTLGKMPEYSILVEDKDTIEDLESAVGIETCSDLVGCHERYLNDCIREFQKMGINNYASCFMIKDCDGYWCVFNGLQFLFKVYDSNDVFYPYIMYLERIFGVCGIGVGVVDFSFSGSVAYIISVKGMKYFLKQKIKRFRMTTNIGEIWDRREEFELELALRGVNFSNRLINKYTNGRVYSDYFELNVDCCVFNSKNNYLIIDY